MRKDINQGHGKLNCETASGDVLADWLWRAMYDGARLYEGFLLWGRHFDGKNTKKYGKWDRSWPIIITIKNANSASNFDLADPRIFVQGNHLSFDLPGISKDSKANFDFKSYFAVEFFSRNDDARILLEENYFYPLKKESWSNRSFFQRNVEYNINEGFIAGHSGKRMNINSKKNLYKRTYFKE